MGKTTVSISDSPMTNTFIFTIYNEDIEKLLQCHEIISGRLYEMRNVLENKVALSDIDVKKKLFHCHVSHAVYYMNDTYNSVVELLNSISD